MEREKPAVCNVNKKWNNGGKIKEEEGSYRGPCPWRCALGALSERTLHNPPSLYNNNAPNKNYKILYLNQFTSDSG